MCKFIKNQPKTYEKKKNLQIYCIEYLALIFCKFFDSEDLRMFFRSFVF
jgi:hypothetical protein